MEKSFWVDRWENDNIGFHQDVLNPFLHKYGEKYFSEDSNVFVPLCGKSHDIVWLAKKCQLVTGIEISEKAVKSFFDENGLNFHSHDNLYTAGNIRIFSGDIFELTAEQLGGTDFIFDRASIVALPEEMRIHYAKKITELSGPGTRILLVAMDYPQNEMQGPPFSVTVNEIKNLYDNNFDIELLEEVDLLKSSSKFSERGITRASEYCLMMKKK